MPWIPRIKYAFLGCTLETGSKIIGLFHMVVYAMAFMVTFFYYMLPYPDTSDPTNYNSTETSELFSNSSESEMMNSTHEHGQNSSYHPDDTMLDIQSTFFLEESAFSQIIFGIILLYGIRLKSADVVFSWILLQLALVWHSQLILALNLILALHKNPSNVAWFLIEETTIVIIEVYCMVVVYNYILVLRNQSSRSTRNF